jgi:hypothetical protein
MSVVLEFIIFIAGVVVITACISRICQEEGDDD